MRSTLFLAIAVLGIAPVFAGDDIYLEGTLSDETGSVGEIATVSLTLYFEGGDAQGFSWSVCHDKDLATIDGFSRGESIEDAEFTFLVFTDYEDGFTCGSLLDVFSDKSLPAETEHEFLLVDYELIDKGETAIEWCSGELSDPPVENSLVIDTEDVSFDSENDGSIEIEPARNFLRGDVSMDGRVSELSDALWLLKWQAQVGEEPICHDAADVNDDGRLSPLLDALDLLRYVFLDADPPPDPGVFDCGPDPTRDELGCEEPLDDC